MSSELFAISVVGRDQPGIVANVTRALFESGCNLEDVTSTILRGHFSMVMIVKGGDGSTPDALRTAIEEATFGGEIAVTVLPVADAHRHESYPTHMVSVYGADRPGIVYRVASLLADRGANITDLTSRVLGSDDDPVYAVMMEVALASDIDQDLAKIGQELGVEVTIHPLDADIL